VSAERLKSAFIFCTASRIHDRFAASPAKPSAMICLPVEPARHDHPLHASYCPQVDVERNCVRPHIVPTCAIDDGMMR
jgi:hypothetical protein